RFEITQGLGIKNSSELSQVGYDLFGKGIGKSVFGQRLSQFASSSLIVLAKPSRGPVFPRGLDQNHRSEHSHTSVNQNINLTCQHLNSFAWLFPVESGNYPHANFHQPTPQFPEITNQNRLLFFLVEIDETYLGVLVMEERGGNAIAQVASDVKQKTLEPIIRANIKEGANVFTDEWRAYNNLGK
ncbi:12612_t:CDS:2, partial [Racocetra persica]